MKIEVCNDTHFFGRGKGTAILCASPTYVYHELPGRPVPATSSEFHMSLAWYFGRAMVIDLSRVGIGALSRVGIGATFAVVATSPLHPESQYSARFARVEDAIEALNTCERCLGMGNPLPGIEMEVHP